MNKFLLSASAVAALALATYSASTVVAQAKPDKAAPDVPHKVALIDMAYVFKNYKKFEVLREDLKTEVSQGEEQAKQKAMAIKALQDKMKTFQESSPEYAKMEEQLARGTADFEAFRRSAQRDFLKKESQIYHTVYMDVADMVKKYAEHYNYTLVMRFTREELDPENAQKLIEGMNRQVVYFRDKDDITDTITDVLNRGFTPTATGGAAPRSTPPASGAPRPAQSTTDKPKPTGTR